MMEYKFKDHGGTLGQAQPRLPRWKQSFATRRKDEVDLIDGSSDIAVGTRILGNFKSVSAAHESVSLNLMRDDISACLGSGEGGASTPW